MSAVDVDVAVVGAGPAGLATAIGAAQAGLSVAVLDPRAAPVDKACGEGLMPTARAELARLGVIPRGREFGGIRYCAPGAVAEARFREAPGLAVRRLALSAALDERAREVGVRRLHERAGSPRVTDDGVDVGPLRARWLVAADGLHSPTRRALGLDAPAQAPTRFGLRRHYRTAPWTDLVEVHWAPDAEAYVTPLGEDLVGVAVLCGGGEPFEGWLDRFPALRERLEGADPDGPVRGAGPLRQTAAAVRRGPVLLVGDAAGYVDALTGEGVGAALLAARELVRCLAAGRPQDYPAAHRRVTRRSRLLTTALLAAGQVPPARRVLVPAAARWPRLMTAAVRALA
ncbi:MAG TPA: NAD(P)/FAD-dependent oxidoreductase [Motilibacteraceae bacterium]|nr:NAD(P)/FAD-dependent oxidoreductase [Motilibacteraceae bacterium]